MPGLIFEVLGEEMQGKGLRGLAGAHVEGGRERRAKGRGVFGDL